MYKFTVGCLLSVVLILVASTRLAQSDFSPTSPSSVSALDVISKYQNVQKLFPDFGKVSQFQRGAAEMYEAYKPLTEDDKSYAPNYNPPGTPQVPAQCAASAECGACFAPAYENLKKLRYRFEKLRRVYSAGKNFAKRSIAFGDSVAGSVGVGGLAWVKERGKIEQSVKGLENAYDRKYAELIAELEGVLKQIARCEEKTYGEKDWYGRYGFMYHQFIADRYQRAD